jgi:hypothetical protein
MKIFAAALEYAPGMRLDGTACTYVRFRVIVDGMDGLWLEEDGSVHEALEVNEIACRSVKEVDGVHVVHIDASKTDLSGFVDWNADLTSSLTLRTFLNVLGSDGKSVFGPDNCWDTISIGNKSLGYWYDRVRG